MNRRLIFRRSPRAICARSRLKTIRPARSTRTHITLSEELPTHAVDAQGQLMDLSQVTDETGFNFHDFYRNQLEIAMSLGDTSRASVLRAVMAFIEI
jgi:hypothetical protein